LKDIKLEEKQDTHPYLTQIPPKPTFRPMTEIGERGGQ
jgi:hypothetical protein